MHMEWNRTRTGLRYLAAAGCLLAAHAANAQTQIDLRTQSKSVDFSAATSTRPSKTGTTAPATCAVGETFFKTNATAGQNWYGCTVTNTVADYPGFLEKSKGTHPLGRVGSVDDISSLALFLASEESSWITGGLHHIDGGRQLMSAR